MSASPAYPVRLEGHLEPKLSRWLWLVKWLLLIPHVIVLAFLWIAFFAVSVVAFFAILFTARYPRSLFDFNVGVMRWTWRVFFYSYSALGTDRYPPFTLGPVPDYPATLDIAYPARLSRGLVLVKWWLLALPHYLVVGVFAGASWLAWHRVGWPGLIAMLVFFAGVALLVRGVYPRSIFDFVLGMDRWVARVAAYAGLMTDEYPPFRLDQGEGEPGTPAAIPGIPADAPATAPRGWSAGRIVLLVVASILVLASLAAVAGGVVAGVIDTTQRDDAGFVMTPTDRFTTLTRAIVSENVDVNIDGPDWFADHAVGTVKLRSESADSVFVGIGPTQSVARYLDGVSRAVVTDIAPNRQETVFGHGARPATPPAEQTFWAASVTGSGEQTLTWNPQDGSWTAVVMNADGARGVSAELAIGAELDWLPWIAAGLIAGGLLVGALAGLGIYFVAPKERRVG